MPSGIYKRSEIHNQHIADSLRNKKKSENHIQHIKDAHKKSKKKYANANKKHSIFMSKYNPMKGKPQCEKQRLAIAEYNKNRVYSIEEREARRQMALNHPNKRFKDTGIELKIEAELQKRGIIYNKQVSLCKIARVDFCLPEYKIVIQCDGCYWHGCKECKLNSFIDKSEKDRRQDAVLTSNGYKVYRFWEHSINKSPKKCLDMLVL